MTEPLPTHSDLITQRTYRVRDLIDYISWPYFLHTWNIPMRFASVANVHPCDACRQGWISAFPEDQQEAAREAIRLMEDARRMLAALTPYVTAHTIVRLMPANSDGDDIVVCPEGAPAEHPDSLIRLPMLRQQIPGNDGFCRSLADYLRPISAGIPDRIGIFASAAQNNAPSLSAVRRMADTQADFHKMDSYDALMAQILCDRLAEAATERLHREVRREIWGYAADEQLTIPDLLLERFKGIRPAVGYPSLPDMSFNRVLDKLIDFSRVGIQLTENAMMQPHSAVSGLMIAHPQSRYFAIGKITEEQLADYARRRQIPADDLRSYLRANLM